MSNVDPQRGKTQRQPGDPGCGGCPAAARPVVRLPKGTAHGQSPCHARPRRRLHRDPRCPRTRPDPQRPTDLHGDGGCGDRRLPGRVGPHVRPAAKAAPAAGPHPDAAPGRPLRTRLPRGRPRGRRPVGPTGRRAGPPLALGGADGLADRAAAGARRTGLQPRRVGRGPRRRHRPEPTRSRAGPGHPVDQPAQRPQADPPRARPRPVPRPAACRRTPTRTPRKTHR